MTDSNRKAEFKKEVDGRIQRILDVVCDGFSSDLEIDDAPLSELHMALIAGQAALFCAVSDNVKALAGCGLIDPATAAAVAQVVGQMSGDIAGEMRAALAGMGKDDGETTDAQIIPFPTSKEVH